MKTIRWEETVVGLTGIWPLHSLIPARPFVDNITDCWLSLVFCAKCPRICLFSERGLKSPDQSTNNKQTGLFMNINYTHSFHSPLAHYEISCSPRQFPNPQKRKRWKKKHNKPAQNKMCNILSQTLLGHIPRRGDSLHVLPYKPSYTSSVIDSSGLSYLGGRS